MSKMNNSQTLTNHYQMTAFLFNNIATACHQLFHSNLLTNKQLGEDQEKIVSFIIFRACSILEHIFHSSFAYNQLFKMNTFKKCC